VPNAKAFDVPTVHGIKQPRHQREPFTLAGLVVIEDVVGHTIPVAPVRPQTLLRLPAGSRRSSDGGSAAVKRHLHRHSYVSDVSP